MPIKHRPYNVLLFVNYTTVEQNMKQYASSGQSRILVADISLMNRREIKNRITVKIWAAVRRVEKYKIGAAVQILETIRFILFFATIHSQDVSQIRDDSFTKGYTNIRDWPLLAYSFIFLVSFES